jgi:uncharacterized membrane protein YuzA (DUF378 family)
MGEQLNFKPFGLSSLVLILVGWGGLFLLINYTRPAVWPRWGFFVLMFMAVTGTILPIVYFFIAASRATCRSGCDRPPGDVVWIHAATPAWLQLDHFVTVYVILGLAGGLAAIEYFMRLREKSHWKPPVPTDDQSS